MYWLYVLFNSVYFIIIQYVCIIIYPLSNTFSFNFRVGEMGIELKKAPYDIPLDPLNNIQDIRYMIKDLCSRSLVSFETMNKACVCFEPQAVASRNDIQIE